MLTIAFTGGGTGGHIYPGLAIASCLKELISCRIFWIGSASGMDKGIVENAGIEFYGISSGKLRRYLSIKNISDIFRVIKGYFMAKKILKKEKPSLLFSKGGFVSVPPCAAASSLKIPVFSHESDYSPGLASRINIRFSEKIFLPYPKSLELIKEKFRHKAFVSGNPVRPDFKSADPKKGYDFLGINEGERILLVLGGSQGSKEINDLVKLCLDDFIQYYTVVHQVGESNEEDIAGKNNPKYFPRAYFKDEMPHIIACSELVLCRSGAGTIWECKSLNKPMIHIPLRGSGTRGDQVENAELFEKMGASLTFIPSPQFTTTQNASALEVLVKAVAKDHVRRNEMAEAKISDNDAASFIAGEIVRRIGHNNAENK